MDKSTATSWARGQVPTSAAASDAAAVSRSNADPASTKRTPITAAHVVAGACYGIAIMLWGVSCFANVTGAFSPGAPAQGAALVAVVAVVACTGILLVPVFRQYFDDGSRSRSAVITAGYLFCLALSCLLSYGTSVSARLVGVAHTADLAGKKADVKEDADAARAALRRFANVPPTETIQAKIDALVATTGIIADCQGPQYSQIARDACKTIGQLRVELGNAKARDAAAKALEKTRDRQLLLADETTRSDNMSTIVKSAAILAGRKITDERAADLAALVSVASTELLLSFFSMLGAAAWGSATQCSTEYGETDRVTQQRQRRTLSDPDATQSTPDTWSPSEHGSARVPARWPVKRPAAPSDTGHLVSVPPTTHPDTLAHNGVQAIDQTRQISPDTLLPALAGHADQLVRLLADRGGTMLASHRMLGQLLGCGKTTVADTLNGLVASGICSVTTTPKGTVIQLVQS